MRGRDGKDTFLLSGKGNDFVDGEGGDYNQVDLRGSAADYTFTRNADGTVTMTSAATGTDILKNIDGVYFYGEGKWYSLGQLAPETAAKTAIAATGTSGGLRDAGGTKVLRSPPH